MEGLDRGIAGLQGRKGALGLIYKEGGARKGAGRQGRGASTIWGRWVEALLRFCVS